MMAEKAMGSDQQLSPPCGDAEACRRRSLFFDSDTQRPGPGPEQSREESKAVDLNGPEPKQHDMLFQMVEDQNQCALTKHHYWQRQPPGLEQLIIEFASNGREVSTLVNNSSADERLLAFLRRALVSFDSHKDLYVGFDMTANAWEPAAVLAANFFLGGENDKGIYMIFYFSLVNELAMRGPNHLKEILETSPLTQVLAHCPYINAFAGHQSRSEVIGILQKFCDSMPCESMEQIDLANILSALQMEKVLGQGELLLHSFQSEKRLCDMIKITGINLDNNSHQLEAFYCSDTTLGWWLKTNTQHISSTKYFRVVHKGRSRFLSSSGKKALQDLGIRDGDELVIGGVCRHDNSDIVSSSKEAFRSKSKPGAKKRNKKSKGAKNTKSKSPRTYVLSEEQLTKQHKLEHSKKMNSVLEALGPILKEIRNQLNNLAIQKSAPKVKYCNLRQAAPQPAPTFLLDNECSLKQACKVAYPVLVGEMSNLYKTSKLSHRHLAKLDLHGCSTDQALERLDKNLPGWVDAAMRGNAPWVLAVDIICGGGSQILSDAVKGWIRANCHVANRPKGLV